MEKPVLRVVDRDRRDRMTGGALRDVYLRRGPHQTVLTATDLSLAEVEWLVACLGVEVRVEGPVGRPGEG